MNLFNRLRGKRVFISYRRSDSAEAAGRIYNALAAELGKKSIFQDVSDIPLGKDFQKVIAEAITQCAVQLVVIGPHWLDAVNEYGQQRLLNPNDIVRLEIELALKHGLRIIPLLVNGATQPKQQSLPVSMQALSNFNGQTIRGGANFEEDMRHIARAIKHPPSQVAEANVEPLVPQLRTPLVYVAHHYEVKSISWSPDGSRIASAGWNDGVYVWEAREGTPTLLHFPDQDKQTDVDIVAWSPDGARIASYCNHSNSISIWCADNGKFERLLTIDDRRGWLESKNPVMCWAPDGKQLAGAGVGLIKVWNVATGQVVATSRRHVFGTNRFTGKDMLDSVRSLCWSSDAKTISYVAAGQIHVWDPAAGQLVRTLGDLRVGRFGIHAWSSDGQRIAADWYAKGEQHQGTQTIAIVDVRDGTFRATYRTNCYYIPWLGWSPDDTRLAMLATLSSTSINQVHVFDVSTGEQLYVFEHEAQVAAWSPEGGRIASGGMDKTVRVWPAPQVLRK